MTQPTPKQKPTIAAIAPTVQQTVPASSNRYRSPSARQQPGVAERCLKVRLERAARVNVGRGKHARRQALRLTDLS